MDIYKINMSIDTYDKYIVHTSVTTNRYFYSLDNFWKEKRKNLSTHRIATQECSKGAECLLSTSPFCDI